MDITKENISSRCKTFDKHYEVISKILSQSGFGWDWENNKLSIDSEDVWYRYVAVSTWIFGFLPFYFYNKTSHLYCVFVLFRITRLQLVTRTRW